MISLASICVKFFAGALGVVVLALLFVCWLNKKQSQETEASYEDAQLAPKLLVNWRICSRVCRNLVAETQNTIKQLRDRDAKLKRKPKPA